MTRPRGGGWSWGCVGLPAVALAMLTMWGCGDDAAGRPDASGNPDGPRADAPPADAADVDAATADAPLADAPSPDGPRVDAADCTGDPRGCVTGQLGVCAAGIVLCTNGSLTCSPFTTPGPEVCNGFDDSCDGRVDENCACIDGDTQSCYGGPIATIGIGLCTTGTQSCANGVWGDCVGDVVPVPEVCNNNQDDDCNEFVDDC